jgi:asparagine synthase (glutamine-hydrolysing)
MLELGGSYTGAYLLRRGLFMPWELGGVLPPEVAAEGLRRLAPLRLISDALKPCPRSAYARVAALESALYMRNQLLRDIDWASMAHGLEVRVPLVDRVLLGRVAALPGLAKTALAQAPSRPLPARALSRPKTGFTTPVACWMRNRIARAEQPGKPRHASQWARQWAEWLAVA